jgi:hypothetical protein
LEVKVVVPHSNFHLVVMMDLHLEDLQRKVEVDFLVEVLVDLVVMVFLLEEIMVKDNNENHDNTIQPIKDHAIAFDQNITYATKRSTRYAGIEGQEG